MSKLDRYLWGGFVIMALLFMLMALASISHFKVRHYDYPVVGPENGSCNCEPLRGAEPRKFERIRI